MTKSVSPMSSTSSPALNADLVALESGTFSILNVLTCSPLFLWLDINNVSIFLKEELPNDIHNGNLDLQSFWDFLANTPGIQQDVMVVFFQELTRHKLPWSLTLPTQVPSADESSPSSADIDTPLHTDELVFDGNTFEIEWNIEEEATEAQDTTKQHGFYTDDLLPDIDTINQGPILGGETLDWGEEGPPPSFAFPPSQPRPPRTQSGTLSLKEDGTFSSDQLDGVTIEWDVSVSAEWDEFPTEDPHTLDVTPDTSEVRPSQDDLDVVFFEDLDFSFDDEDFPALSQQDLQAVGGTSPVASLDDLLAVPQWETNTPEERIEQTQRILLDVLSASPLALWVNMDSFQQLLQRRLEQYTAGEILDLAPVWYNLNSIPGAQKAAVEGFFDELLRHPLPWHICLPDDFPQTSLPKGLTFASREQFDKASKAKEQLRRDSAPVAGTATTPQTVQTQTIQPKPKKKDELTAGFSDDLLDIVDNVSVYGEEEDDMGIVFGAPQTRRPTRPHFSPKPDHRRTPSGRHLPAAITQGIPFEEEEPIDGLAGPIAESLKSPVIKAMLGVIILLLIAVIFLLPGALTTPKPNETRPAGGLQSGFLKASNKHKSSKPATDAGPSGEQTNPDAGSDDDDDDDDVDIPTNL